MKRSLLVVTMLLSGSVMAAVPFEEAQARLARVQDERDAAKRRSEELSSRAEGIHKSTQEIAGKHEYRTDMKKRTARFRSDVEAYNRSVEEYKGCVRKCQDVIAELGHEYTMSADGNGRYALTRPEPQDLQPIVTQPAESVRYQAPSYSSSYTSTATRTVRPARAYRTR